VWRQRYGAWNAGRGVGSATAGARDTGSATAGDTSTATAGSDTGSATSAASIVLRCDCDHR